MGSGVHAPPKYTYKNSSPHLLMATPIPRDAMPASAPAAAAASASDGLLAQLHRDLDVLDVTSDVPATLLDVVDRTVLAGGRPHLAALLSAPLVHDPAVLARRQAAALDRISNGRLLINVVTGGDQGELEADGLYADHAKRYEISDEFIRVWRASLAGEGGDLIGRQPGGIDDPARTQAHRLIAADLESQAPGFASQHLDR